MATIGTIALLGMLGANVALGIGLIYWSIASSLWSADQ